MIPAAIIHACAPFAAQSTVAAVIRVESGGNPFALNINGGPAVRASSLTEAVKIARSAIKAGYRVDMGLMQVDSENLKSIGATVPEMFDPCANIHAGALILSADYEAALQRAAPGKPALEMALSAYNTGSFEAGFLNGYVGKYYGQPIPAVQLNPATVSPSVSLKKNSDKQNPNDNVPVLASTSIALTGLRDEAAGTTPPTADFKHTPTPTLVHFTPKETDHGPETNADSHRKSR